MESEQDVIVDWMHCWWYWLLLFISINLSKLVMSVETLQKAISNVIFTTGVTIILDHWMKVKK